jgi:hypothetical protein
MALVTVRPLSLARVISERRHFEFIARAKSDEYGVLLGDRRFKRGGISVDKFMSIKSHGWNTFWSRRPCTYLMKLAPYEIPNYKENPLLPPSLFYQA